MERTGSRLIKSFRKRYTLVLLIRNLVLKVKIETMKGDHKSTFLTMGINSSKEIN